MSEPSFSWVKQLKALNTTGYEYSNSITSSPSGNVYIGYTTSGTISGGTLRGGIDIVVAKMNTTGSVVWTKQLASLNTTATEQNITVCTDSLENIYISYETGTSVSGGVLTTANDIVVAKMDSNGNLIWIKQHSVLNAGNNSYPNMKVSSSGNCYLCYTTNTTMSGGTFRGGNDIVLAKLDTNGNVVWLKQYGAINGGSFTFEVIPKIAIDSSENAYVTYMTTGTVSGGTAQGSYDIVVTKLNSSGALIWLKQYLALNTTSNEQYPSIGVDSSGNVYITYYNEGTISGGTRMGNIDIVVAKLDTNGAIVWTKQQSTFNTTGVDAAPYIAVDSNGNSFIMYYTTGTVSGGTLLGGADIVLMHMNTNGNVVWIKQSNIFNTTSDDLVVNGSNNITLDSDGNIYVCYDTTGTVSGGTNMGGASPYDIVILKYSQQFIPASASQAVTSGEISTYINAQTVTTDADKAALTIDMRNAIKNATYANNAAKAADQKAYIDAMRTKVGASSYIVPEANFTDFKSTLSSSASGLTAKPIMVYVPAYTANTATIDIDGYDNSNYMHVEIPVTYSMTIQNGVDTITLTFDGTKFIDNSEVQYLIGDSIIIGSKTLTIIGFGSGQFDITNTGEATCMVKGTLITTPSGEQPIETLSKGDLVITGNGVKTPITNIHKIVIVRANDINVPYIIKKNAFGTNKPARDVCVSPRHAIQLRPGVWEIPREAAKENANVCKDTDGLNKRVIYYHFSLPNYETDTIIANGQITECLNDGSVKESYVWNAVEKGYTRTIQRIDNNKLSKSA